MHVGPWDYALLIATTLQVALVAYLYEPRWKAMAMSLPVPFTLASLAALSVGAGYVDASNIFGLVLLLLFTNVVRWLHYGLKAPIVPSIALATVGYCTAAWAMASRIPRDDLTFYISTGMIAVLAAVLLLNTPHVTEPGHRTPLPAYIKLPGIALLVICMIVSKGLLRNFITTYPMVTTFAAYEARHSLRTLCRQVPLLILVLMPMLSVIRALQGHIGLGAALVLGWIVFLLILLPIIYRTHVMVSATAEQAAAEEQEIVPATPAGS